MRLKIRQRSCFFKHSHISVSNFKRLLLRWNLSSIEFIHDIVWLYAQCDYTIFPFNFIYNKKLWIGENRVTTPTAPESVLPWKRADDKEDDSVIQQTEFPSWANNKEYLAYNSPSATFLGKFIYIIYLFKFRKLKQLLRQRIISQDACDSSFMKFFNIYIKKYSLNVCLWLFQRLCFLWHSLHFDLISLLLLSILYYEWLILYELFLHICTYI